MDEDEKLELEFLRHFYAEADEAMGPASDDIYTMIKKDFLQEHGKLPSGYKLVDDE